MISPESLKLLQTIKTSPYGKALQEYLDEQYNIINDVKACKSFDEVLGRKYALEAMEKLFGFMQEKKTVIKSNNVYE